MAFGEAKGDWDGRPEDEGMVGCSVGLPCCCRCASSSCLPGFPQSTDCPSTVPVIIRDPVKMRLCGVGVLPCSCAYSGLVYGRGFRGRILTDSLSVREGEGCRCIEE